jgi:hypothetical protein
MLVRVFINPNSIKVKQSIDDGQHQNLLKLNN